jgi:NAD(P)H-hydrate epimerase
MFKDIDKYILGIIETPDISMEEQSLKIKLTECGDVRNIIKERKRASHKGTYGRVGILSGSKGMAGAAVLNCNAALRSGSGLVKACVTEAIYGIVESMAIEAITYAFDEENVSFDELDRELIRFSDVIATGSGCTNMKSYRDILEFLIRNSEKPLVIDAEGINLLNSDMLINHKQSMILTPHYGEMARLTGKDTDYLREDIIEKAAEFAGKYDIYLVLKGARTVIACPGGNNYINTTGNPGMATAGSGDVLTGIIAALIGQGIEITDALRAAVYIHGLAGDIGSSFVGEYSLIAGDIIRYLPEAFKAVYPSV